MATLRFHRRTVATVTFLFGSVAITASGAESTARSLELRFAEVVQPFLTKYCLRCHGPEKQEGKLDLSGNASVAAVVRNHQVWDILVVRLAAEEMPPRQAPLLPTAVERTAVIEWAKTLREEEARRHAGDPGTVLPRRLSHAEFDYTIRDLTGVDIRPTREFPVDPANAAGFDNSGESLTMSPALLNKYLAAAGKVADHLVLKPHGFVFAPHPVVTETDRDKYCVQRIVAFYRRHQVDYADYFLAAWRFQHRQELGRPNASLQDFAAEARLSARYLAAIWTFLTESGSVPERVSEPVAELLAKWRSLPADVRQEEEARRASEMLRDAVTASRRRLVATVDRLHVDGISDGSQPFVLWWNRQLAARRMRYAGDGKDPSRDESLAHFCRLFPDTFSVSARGAYFDPKLGAEARLLTAGFHLMQGYFRDDRPLVDLVLDEAGQREIETLWQELHFVTLAPLRQYKDFIFFERAEPPRFAGGPEFDFARSEDKEVTSVAKMEQLRQVYLAKAREKGASGAAVEAIEIFFANMSADIRWIETAQLAAEPSHLESLLAFAARAYRRPLSVAEQDELRAFYRRLRDQDGLSHEDALRDTVISVLLSPYFLYRVNLPAPGSSTGRFERHRPAGLGELTAEIVPLSDDSLASRLSYFLWSSMPDAELLTLAAAGELNTPERLIAQTRRMLRDDRVRGLATEFAGNWLDFRRFDEHNSVDRERFASFTSELRQAMYEEPLRFFVDVASQNRSVLDFLYADHTFVNPILAKHYGIQIVAADPDAWVRVDEAHRYHRGGLLPMSAFLTKNSPGLRTSPVKRGYWVVRRLLGEHIPPPPPDVPELPQDEAKLGDLTLRELLARHRNHRACSGCHQRFDSIGLVFEGYGPIGERRDHDLGGRAIEERVLFPNGSEGSGLDGLRHYLSQHRQHEFIVNFTGKLLAYALGRSLLRSDQTTLESMQAKLASDGYRFHSLVESIVTSPQFMNQRSAE